MVKRPEVGDVAPGFMLPEAYGGSVQLSSLLQKGTVVMVFYPSDWGVMCSVEMKMMQLLVPHFKERGAIIIGISTNSVISHSAWKEHMGFTFPLLADFFGKVSDSYGVLVGEEGYMMGRSMRAVVVIDRWAKVRFRWETEDNASEPDYDELLRVCAHINSTSH